MLEKERGRRRGLRQDRRQEQCDKTQRDFHHLIAQSSAGTTCVYKQAVTGRVPTPIMAAVGKRLPL